MEENLVVTKTRVDLINDGKSQVSVFPDWFENHESLFEKLTREDFEWEDHSLRIMGKWVKEPRRTFAVGDPGLIHKYTGTERTVIEWDQVGEVGGEIKDIAVRIGQEIEFFPNACLLNFYRNGSDYIGWHSDKEVEGPDYEVVTVSLGGERDIIFRNKESKEKRCYALKAGDACLMAGDTQKFWMHTIPKRKKQNEPRISLTFRKLYQQKK